MNTKVTAYPEKISEKDQLIDSILFFLTIIDISSFEADTLTRILYCMQWDRTMTRGDVAEGYAVLNDILKVRNEG